MKIKIIAIGTLIITSIVSSSCKKEDTVEPVNVTSSIATPCSTCPSSFITLDSVGILGGVINTSYVHATNFTVRNGTTHYGGHQFKTAQGIYGLSGLALDFNLSALSLSSIPTQVSFTHAREIGNTPIISAEANLVNVKFAGTPLIVTTADSLGFYLTPFGYTVQHYYYPTVINRGFPFSWGPVVAFADSVVIVGSITNNLKIGVNQFESELRNICFKVN